jgi:hypothetical protein
VPELLDQAFRVYRRHFLTFLAIIAIVHVPLQLLIQAANIIMLGDYTNWLTALEQNPTGERATSAAFPSLGLWYMAVLALSLVYWLLQSLSQGALTAAIANSYMDRPVSFGQAYRSMLRRIGPLLGTIGLQVLIGIAIFSPFIILLLLSMASMLMSTTGAAGGGSSDSYSEAAGIGLMCIAFLLIVPLGVLAIYVFVRLSVMVPALMVEGVGPVQALKRSWALINNSWWRTVGLLLLLGLLNYVISEGPAYFITGIIGLFMRRVDPITLSAMTASVQVFTSLIYIPVELSSVTLYYFDLRVRKEGYDLEAAIDRQFGPMLTPTVQTQWQSQ